MAQLPIASADQVVLIGRNNDVITLHKCFRFFIFNIFIEKNAFKIVFFRFTI